MMKKWYSNLNPTVKLIVDILLILIGGVIGYLLFLSWNWIKEKITNPNGQTEMKALNNAVEEAEKEEIKVSQKQTPSYSDSVYAALANEAFTIFDNNMNISEYAYKSWRSKIHHYVDYLKVAKAFGTRQVDVSDVPFSGTELCTLDTMITKRCEGGLLKQNETVLADWNGSKAGWYNAFKKL